MRSEVSRLRSEVHELRRRSETRMPDVRPMTKDAESRKRFEAEHKARMEERRRQHEERRKMHEDRRREMEERRKGGKAAMPESAGQKGSDEQKKPNEK